MNFVWGPSFPPAFSCAHPFHFGPLHPSFPLYFSPYGPYHHPLALLAQFAPRTRPFLSLVYCPESMAPLLRGAAPIAPPSDSLIRSIQAVSASAIKQAFACFFLQGLGVPLRVASFFAKATSLPLVILGPFVFFMPGSYGCPFFSFSTVCNCCPAREFSLVVLPFFLRTRRRFVDSRVQSVSFFHSEAFQADIGEA